MGTGEVTRHLGICGSGRVAKAVLIGVIALFLLKTDDNPEGSTKGSSTDQGRGGRGGSASAFEIGGEGVGSLP